MSPGAGTQSVDKAASILFIIHDTGDSSKQELLRSGTAPHVSTLCLSNVTACVSQVFPSLYLYTVSDQMLEVGMAWEQGYLRNTHLCNSQWN